MKRSFELAEQDPHTDHAWAQEKLNELRPLLLHWQQERLEKADQALLIVVAGMDGVGKGSAVNTLNTWLDPRHVHTLAFSEPTEEEIMRPAMWRYWNSLPAKGQTGLVFGSWYGALMNELQSKHGDPIKLDRYVRVIKQFEAELAYQGVKILKLWFHSSQQAQAQRCQDLLANPDTAWRVTKKDLKVQKKFKQIRRAAMETITLTHTSHAPWVMVPSADPFTRDLTVAQAVLNAMQKPVQSQEVEAPEYLDWPLAKPPLELRALKQVKSPMSKEHYEKELLHWQARISKAVRGKAFQSHSLIILFEGEDAAGKGGAIKRLTAALDVRDYDVHPIAAPAAYELARPYLWRFWTRLPRHKKIAIFDRSWYGRVLVERVEKLAPVAAWKRSYAEINNFEAQLVANSTLVLKFWLSVSKDEQLRRFQERETSPLKTYKITEEDWRNRGKWNAYRTAAQDMLDHTHTGYAPWHLVASNDKRTARIQILQQVCEVLESLQHAHSDTYLRLTEPEPTQLINEQV